MKEIKLPFYSIFVCEICGNTSENRHRIEECELVKPWEESDVKAGEEVLIYGNTWQNERFVGISKIPKNFVITSLFYAGRDSAVLGKQQPKRHQLCVTLSRRINGGISSIYSLTFSEFSLWREKDEVDGGDYKESLVERCLRIFRTAP